MSSWLMNIGYRTKVFGKKKTCQRCGTKYRSYHMDNKTLFSQDGGPEGSVVVTGYFIDNEKGQMYQGNKFDSRIPDDVFLCPSCLEELKRFLNNER